MAIIILQHSELSHSGRLGRTLRDHAYRLDIRRLDKGDEVPPDFDGVTGVISLGGPQNVGEDHPWMEAELDYLRGAHDRQLPLVGVCLGAQLIAAALGGVVGPMDKPEVGFHRISINPAGQIDTILAGVQWSSMQFCHHAYEVKQLPEGATLLASSDRCKTQIFRAGLRTYGFQQHFEVDQDMIRAYLRNDHEYLERGGTSESRILEQMDEHYTRFARLADRLCVNLSAFLAPAWTRVGV